MVRGVPTWVGMRKKIAKVELLPLLALSLKGVVGSKRLVEKGKLPSIQDCDSVGDSCLFVVG